jgi:apolipoprotein N-acyltransferase
MPGPARVTLALATGVLLFLSFPKFGTGLLAWIALAPLLLALEGASPLRGGLLAYAAGVSSSVGLLYWTSLVVVRFGGLSLPVGILVMVLLALAFSLFTLGFGLVVSLWVGRFGRGALLLSPLAWVTFELLRSHILFSFPWVLLGYSQTADVPAIQIASYTAVYGVSFALALTAALLAYALGPGRRGSAFLALLAVVFGVHAYGAWTLGRPLPAGPAVTVGLVQGNVPEEEKWEPGRETRNFLRHEALTRTARERGARLVVWPESSLPFPFDSTPSIARELRALARELSIDLLFGNDDEEPGASASRYFVGAKMLDPEGALALRYHKIHLVPFGEYVPMSGLLRRMGVSKLVQQVADFSPGEAYTLGAVDGHPIGAFICYEGIFPDLVRRFSKGGAELLVNITNDAWYGRTSAPYQHFATLVFRAVESRRFLVRAANTGITAVIDPRGRVLERTQLFEEAVLVRSVSFVSGETFYAAHGDVFAWACAGATAALSLLALRRTG